MTDVDVVVVSYNSRNQLRTCVERLVGVPGIHVVVVDNASPDRGLETVRGLPLLAIQAGDNLGFAHGSNLGWRRTRSPLVLFLNPDASIDPLDVRQLAAILEQRDEVGIVAPRIVRADGATHYSIRREPRVASSFSQALFLHRLFPRAEWTDEVVRRPAAYEEPGCHEWVSGACLMIRRSTLERLGGWDEGYFLYCEDTDLCVRVRSLGLCVAYEPSTVARHVGGASAPRSATLPVLAASRVRYASRHRGRTATLLERLAIGLGSGPRALVGPRSARKGHRLALRVAMGIPATQPARSRSPISPPPG